MTNLNTLVATRVMGWPVIDFSQQAPKGGYIRLACAYYGTDHRRRCEIFHPASNISAAFEVVDAMHSNGWRLALEWFTNRYRAHFANSPFWDWHFNGEHLNPATAICLSALRAVGVSEDEIQAAIGEQQ